jgi:hypothetical protein
LPESEYNKEESMKLLKNSSFDLTKILQIKENVEKSRPFLGEHIWSLFVIYTILIGRVSYLLIEGRNKNDIKSWDKDEHIQFILKKLYDDEEIESIFSKRTDSFDRVTGSFDRATELLEQKILFEMLKIISGESAAESDFSNVKKFHELMKVKIND